MARLCYLSRINFHILAIIVFTSQQKVKIVEYCHQTKSFVSIRRMNSFTVEISFTFAEIDKLSVKCNIILEKLFPLYDGFWWIYSYIIFKNPGFMHQEQPTYSFSTITIHATRWCSNVVGGSRGLKKAKRNNVRQITKFGIIVFYKILINIWI